MLPLTSAGGVIFEGRVLCPLTAEPAEIAPLYRLVGLYTNGVLLIEL